MSTQTKLQQLQETMENLYNQIQAKQDECSAQKMSWNEYQAATAAERKAYDKASMEYRSLVDVEITEDIPDYGDHMTIEDFIECAKSGGFIDYDGSGNYATKDKMTDIEIYPSDITAGVYRKDFTHVVWFNK